MPEHRPGPSEASKNASRGTAKLEGMQGYMYCMHPYIPVKVPKPVFARPGANPTLETIEYIRKALQTADEPISRNALLERLRKWGHSTSRQSLNAALRFFDDMGMVAEGSKGLIWVPEASDALVEVIRKGQRL